MIDGDPNPSEDVTHRLSRSYRTRLKVWESLYGRLSDWVVLSKDGRVIGTLTGARWGGDFFHDYDLSILAEDGHIRAALLDTTFWQEANYRFQNSEFGDIVRAFATADPEFPLSIRTRGLAIEQAEPSLLDELVLLVRRPFVRRFAQS
jgi:hypothetical protein